MANDEPENQPEPEPTPEPTEVDETWLREQFESLSARQQEQAQRLIDQGAALQKIEQLIEAMQARNNPQPEPAPQPAPDPTPEPSPAPEPTPTPTPAPAKKLTYQRRPL